MSNILLTRNYQAEAAIAAFSPVKFGSVDGKVLVAVLPTDKIIGVTTDIAAAIGERCDVVVSGRVDIVYGAAVTRGDLLTADATGRAVTAAPAAGVNNRIIGTASVSGVAGDIGACDIYPSMLQG